MSNSPKVSVCMPMYNASRYLRECIDSVLAQTFTDFEFLIADDGSTDNSADIVESYTDPRIHLIKLDHNYIATLNRLVAEAKGAYIARMDADDIMLNDRLMSQYNFLERHREIDLLFGGVKIISASGENLNQQCSTTKGYISLCELSEECCLVHPTAFIRTSSITARKPMLYNPKYIFAEDYNLWVELVIDGCIIYNSEQIYGYYRRHSDQISAVNYPTQRDKSSEIRRRAIRYLSYITHQESCTRIDIPKSGNKLSIIIPFLNEQEEVKNTIESIRTTAGNSVDIIVINDNSDTDYDYVSDLDNIDVIYIVNKHRIGASMSKEKGVNLVKTPYFLILDAHMRFYSTDWVSNIISELDLNPNRLLCCQSIALEKDNNGIIHKSTSTWSSHGAFMSFDADSYVPGIKWDNSSHTDNGATAAIPCVLGAGYASSKRYWDKLAGMRGLQHYGCEEVYISTKSWLEGGGCYLLPNLTIGHIYRKKFPYPVYSSQYIYNYLLIADTLFPTSDQCFAHAVAWKLNKLSYIRALERIHANAEELSRIKSYFRTWDITNYSVFKRLNINCAIRNNKDQIAKGEIDAIIKILIQGSSLTLATNICSKMAHLVAVLSYIHTNTGALDNEDIIEKLWDDIIQCIPQCNDYSFSTGLAGCGWLLIYAIEHELFEDDITVYLNQIDNKISICSPSRISDLSLMSGLGGICAYVATRLGYNKRHNLINHFNPSFIQELYECIPSVFNKTSDWRTFNFSLQLQKLEKPDWNILSPNLYEIIENSSVIPHNPEFWDYSINGIFGQIIKIFQHET